MAFLLQTILSLVVSAFFSVVDANLGVALRRSAARNGQHVIPAAITPTNHRGPLVVELQRFGARPIKGGLGSDVSSFYVGAVTIGQPAQTLQVLFDTSSGQVIVPHRACKSSACLEHQRYSPWQSLSSSDVNGNGTLVQRHHRLARGNVTREGASIVFTQADLGEGTAKGVFVRDQICLAEGICSEMALVAATHMEDVPFRAMPHDGIVGLGLTGLSYRPSTNFLHQWFSRFKDVPRQFGLSLNRHGGELYFGGYDQSRVTAPVRWFPVFQPREGYWQVRIASVRVGNVTLDACSGGCRGIIDTGAARLGVLPDKLPAFLHALAPTVAATGRCHGPSLEFDLGGMQLVLGPQDYAESSSCAPQLGTINPGHESEVNGIYALGESVLRRYYTAFDWDNKQVGFAPSSAALAAPSADAGVERIIV